MELSSVVALSLLLSLQSFSLASASSHHFPDCRGACDIKRIFNILDILFLEEHLNNHSAYFSWDIQLKKFIKADWLYSLAIGRDFQGVIWEKGSDTFQLVFSPWMANKVKYNSEQNLFHIIERELTEIPPNKRPAITVKSTNLRIYQTGDEDIYYFDKATQLLYQAGSDQPQKLTFMLNGVFNKSKKIYFYVNCISILDQATQGNQSLQKHLQFKDVLECRKEKQTNFALLIGAIAQVLLVMLLIFLNIKYAIDWLNYKPKSKISERIDSRAPFTDSRQPSSSQPSSNQPFSGRPRESATSARKNSPATRKRRPRPSPSSTESSKKKTPMKKTVKFVRNKLRTVSNPSTTDSVADCYKR